MHLVSQDDFMQGKAFILYLQSDLDVNTPLFLDRHVFSQLQNAEEFENKSLLPRLLYYYWENELS